MMAMVKIILLMLVVCRATALENSSEIESNHGLTPYPSPQASRSVNEDRPSTVVRAVQCAFACQDKKSFQKAICIGICIAKCVVSPSDSLYEVACAADCAQSSTNNLRYDANMVTDLVTSCNEQCKRN